MDFIATRALATLLLPPLDLLLLGLLGLLLLPWRRMTGVLMLLVSLLGLFVLSMPVVSTALASLLESRTSIGGSTADAQAIVILGGGTYADAPEYAADTVSAATLERVRWGARLQRLTGLPVLVSGGTPFSTRTSEASQMKAVLTQDFRVEVKWVEEKSLTTFENAHDARALLAREKIDRILLVTHALHMPRARLVFEHAGFHVAEAPTGFTTLRPPGVLAYLPSARALATSSAVLHEAIGLGWYHLRLAGLEQKKDQQ